MITWKYYQEIKSRLRRIDLHTSWGVFQGSVHVETSQVRYIHRLWRGSGFWGIHTPRILFGGFSPPGRALNASSLSLTLVLLLLSHWFSGLKRNKSAQKIHHLSFRLINNHLRTQLCVYQDQDNCAYLRFFSFCTF